MKPPTPRLSSTWDVKRLLEFLATLDPPAGLTLKMLSFKLAALLALTSSARAHELIKLDLDFVSIKRDSWEFSLAGHSKVSRPGHLARKIYLPAFPDNPKICVVKTLQDNDPGRSPDGNLLASCFHLSDRLNPSQVRQCPDG